MKIAVFSDTHLGSPRGLPQKALDLVESADAIIHAGDYLDISVVETLMGLKDFYGVCGNMDHARVRTFLPEKRVMDLAGYKIGLTHGWGSPNGIEKRVATLFADQNLDVLVFGHSHTPCNQLIDNVLFFNPGSPTDRRYAPYCSMGILILEETTLRGEIIIL